MENRAYVTCNFVHLSEPLSDSYWEWRMTLAGLRVIIAESTGGRQMLFSSWNNSTVT